MDWLKKRVVVTGGAGFLGTTVVRKLKERGSHQVFIPRSKEYDLRTESAIKRLFEVHRPDIVVHLAAITGGIGANMKNPGRFFYDNAIMGIQLMEFARRFGVEKFAHVGTICSYPKYTPTPFREEDLWLGFPEETNAPYGLAKKMGLIQAKAYREEYGFNAICLLPVNLYGPGDNFDLDSSHVIPAIVRKCIEAKNKPITLWGDGSPSREFLFVDDAAEGICLALEKYNDCMPVNLGSGQEITIKDLATIIAKKVGFEGEIRWDTTKPNGQPRRFLDVSRAKHLFGFTAQTSFDEGIEKTVRYFLSTRPQSIRSERPVELFVK